MLRTDAQTDHPLKPNFGVKKTKNVRDCKITMSFGLKGIFSLPLIGQRM